MNNLPEDVKKEIYSYLMTCNSHHKYIHDKESFKYYKNRAEYKYCAPVKVLNKDICQHCDAVLNTTILARQILNIVANLVD